MGVEKFFSVRLIAGPYAGQTVGELGQRRSWSDLRGKRICIDAPIIIYGALHALKGGLSDQEGKVTAHLLVVLNKVLQLARAGVSQLWIFDSGVPNPRKKRRAASGVVTSTHIREVQKLLSLLGIIYVVAPPGCEAEKYGAFLTQGPEAFCYAMLSADSDVLIFGGHLLRIVGEKIYYFNYQELLENLALRGEELVQLALLLGNDFCAKTRGVGPGTVLKKIQNQDFVLSAEQEGAAQEFQGKILNMRAAQIHEHTFVAASALAFLRARGFRNLEKKLQILEIEEKGQ